MTRRLVRGDRGQVGGIEVLPFGLLVFVVGTLFVTSVWSVVDARFAVDTAARNAARVLAESTDQGDVGAASRAAHEAMEGAGRAGPVGVVVHVDGPAIGRCTPVSVTVSYAVPTVRAPFLGASGPAVTVRATHRTLVDPLRSGLTGEATCVG